jgi:hypothetical protein
MEDNDMIYYFHATPARNVDSILRQGILPTAQSPHEEWVSYPEPRVYLVRGEQHVNELIDLIELTSANFQPDGKWAIIVVDADGVVDPQPDPEIPSNTYFVYTTYRVPASACNVYDTFEF